jgi:transcriptional regulator, AsnC family
MSDRSNGLDEIDVTILSSLSKNGRYSIKYLSDITGISKPAVKKRIDNLIEDGIIEGFTAKLNIKNSVTILYSTAWLEFQMRIIQWRWRKNSGI